jgi:CxxC-x17-CxxC domain-containing protein
MRDFSRDRQQGGGRDFKRRDFDRPQTMFKTICSDCGKECEVPFKPNGSKPVFCRDCFQGKRNSEGPRDNNFPPRRPNFDDRGQNQMPPPPPPHKEEFAALNAKLDRILSLLNMLSEARSQEGMIVKEKIKKPVVATPVVVTEPAVVEPVTEVESAPVVKAKLSGTKSSKAGKASKKKLAK